MNFHSYKTVFTGNNLTQISTIKSVIQFAVSLGLLHMSPELQNATSQAIVNIIVAGQLALAALNLWHDERNHVVVNAGIINTTAPVNVAGGATVTTNDKGNL